MDYSKIRGFNYQPSYGSTALEIWLNFDRQAVKTELERGKKYFPGMNAIRLWLSWDAFVRNNEKFLEYFEESLRIADSLDLKVMPVLFNRWHNDFLDLGGIYIDHFLPGTSQCQTDNLFEPYIKKVVGSHRDDGRIFAWDICNEPFSYTFGFPVSYIGNVFNAELLWLKKIIGCCKKYEVKAPLTVGIHNYHWTDDLQVVAPFCDILSIHPYWCKDTPRHEKKDFEKQLNGFTEIARVFNKPLLATETCWGSQDDDEHVEIIKYTLGELTKRNIGFIVHLLHHSLVADAHREEYGPVSFPGNLSFIEADGTLRKGHEIFNGF